MHVHFFFIDRFNRKKTDRERPKGESGGEDGEYMGG